MGDEGRDGGDFDGRFVTVGIGGYRDSAWSPLNHVPGSVERLRGLLGSLGYGQDLPELTEGGSWAHITRRLKAWRTGGERLVLYWTGHGCVDAGEHFLVTRDTPAARLDDFNAVSARALARFLVHQEFREVLVLIDCCASGVAASRVAAEIGQVIDHSSSAGPDHRFAVIASACGYDSAEEGVFAETLEQVVRRGPEDRRWTEHDAMIRSDELADVMARVMAGRDGRTAYIARGAPVPALRNPLHPETAVVPDEDVETKQLRRSRTSDIDQHLVLSARGIEVGETGWYFCGRDRLIRRLIRWLDTAGRGLFVVTGSPGTGKSALLGRIATLSDPHLRLVAEAEGVLNDTPNAALPTRGSIDVALSCRNKTLDDCLLALVDALRLPVPADGRLRAAQIVQQVGELRRPVAVVLDGLDEAKPAEAVPIAADLLRPLADLPGVRVLVGTRPHRAGDREHAYRRGPLLQALSSDETVVLDDEPGTEADLTAYALRRLLGAEGSPLRGREPEAREWARRVAEASSGIFLYARVASRAVLTAVADGREPWDGALSRLLSGGLTAVLDEEFARVADPRRVRDLLRPLAWAEGAGLPRRDLWPVLATALAEDRRVYTDADVGWVLAHAGFHLVESGESGHTVYRLYHQALIDHFRALSPGDAQTRITHALLATVRGPGPAAWADAHPYLARHMAAHALAGGLLPEVMRDPGFLGTADPARMEAAVRALPERFSAPVARLYLRVAHRLVRLDPHARLRVLRMTALSEEPSLLGRFGGPAAAPAQVEASSTAADDFSIALRGHAGPVTALAVCRDTDGRELLASAGGDTTVRVWDPDTGETRRVLTGAGTVTALAGLTDARGRRLLAAAAGPEILVWDLADGRKVAVLRGHSDTVLALAGLDVSGPPLLVSAGKDRALRLWNLESGTGTVLTGHLGPVAALAVTVLRDGSRLVLSGGADCTVRCWEADTRKPVPTLVGHTGPVYALACFDSADGRKLAASGGDDGTVRVWDLERGTTSWVVPGDVGGVCAVVPFASDGRTLLAVAGRASRIRIVDPATGRPVRQLNTRMAQSFDQEAADTAVGTQVAFNGDHLYLPRVPLRNETYAMVALTTGRGDSLFSSAGWDGTLRLWDAGSGGTPGQPDYDLGRASRIVALGPATGAEWSLVVAGARGGAWLTTPHATKRLETWPARAPVTGLAALILPNGRLVVVLGRGNRDVRLVDATTGEEIHDADGSEGFGWSGNDLRSLRTVTDPGRTAVLVVNLQKAGSRTLIWRQDGTMQSFVDAPDDKRSELVPFFGPDGTLRFGRVDRAGGLGLHTGTPDSRPRKLTGLRVGPLPDHVSHLSPLALLTGSGKRDTRLGVVHETGGRTLLRIHGLGSFRSKTTELGLPGPLTHWAALHHEGQDLIVGAGEDEFLRVWNPAHLDRPPLVIPLTGPAQDLSTATPGLVCVLVDEHWTLLRLTRLDALCAP